MMHTLAAPKPQAKINQPIPEPGLVPKMPPPMMTIRAWFFNIYSPSILGSNSIKGNCCLIRHKEAREN